MRLLNLFGFGDTAILLTRSFRRLGVDCDAMFSSRAFQTQGPKWTKKYPELDHGIYTWDSSNLQDPRPVAQLMKFCRQYDMLIAHPPSSTYAWMTGTPYCTWDGGSGNFTFDSRSISRKRDIYTHEMSRRSYKHAHYNFMNDIDVYYNAWPQMKWHHDRAGYMPLPVDTDLFKPMDTQPNEQFTIYIPTRMEIMNKGLHLILQGLKSFTTEYPHTSIKITRYGSDVPVMEHLIEQLELDDYIEWVPVVPKQTFAQLLNHADVVIDQLSRGAVGGVTWQALACETPAICAVHHPWYTEQLGTKAPILNAWTPDMLAYHLADVYEDRIGHMPMREYIQEHFHPDNVARKMLHILEEEQ